jgi:hypothetical protein
VRPSKLVNSASTTFQSSCAPTAISRSYKVQPLNDALPLPPPPLQGYLFPSYHITYWTGLYSNGTAPSRDWGWIYPPPNGRSGLLQPSSYSRWGLPQPEDLGLPPEPNNLNPPEQCAAANASEAYWPGDAWAWADANCNARMVAMCRIMPPGLFW